MLFQDVGADIQRPHQDIGRTGTLDGLQFVLQFIQILTSEFRVLSRKHSSAAHVQHCALGQRTQRLVDAVDDEIRPAAFRSLRHQQIFSCLRYRQTFSLQLRGSFEKLQVGAVGLIDDQHLSRFMDHLRDLADITADPVIVGTGQDNRFRLRLLQQPSDLFRFHRTRDPVLSHFRRMRVQRLDVPQHQSVEHRLMAIARHDQFLSRRDTCKDRSNESPTGPIDQQV